MNWFKHTQTDSNACKKNQTHVKWRDAVGWNFSAGLVMMSCAEISSSRVISQSKSVFLVFSNNHHRTPPPSLMKNLIFLVLMHETRVDPSPRWVQPPDCRHLWRLRGGHNWVGPLLRRNIRWLLTLMKLFIGALKNWCFLDWCSAGVWGVPAGSDPIRTHLSPALGLLKVLLTRWCQDFWLVLTFYNPGERIVFHWIAPHDHNLIGQIPQLDWSRSTNEMFDAVTPLAFFTLFFLKKNWWGVEVPRNLKKHPGVRNHKDVKLFKTVTKLVCQHGALDKIRGWTPH